MASILKVDTIQKADGSTPSIADLGIDLPEGKIDIIPNNSNFTITTTYFVDTGLEVVITPTKIGSKILITPTVQVYFPPFGTSWSALRLSVQVNSVSLPLQELAGNEYGTAAAKGYEAMHTAVQNYEYTTTSLDPLTIKLFGAIKNSGSSAVINHYGGGSLTAIEVKG